MAGLEEVYERQSSQRTENENGANVRDFVSDGEDDEHVVNLKEAIDINDLREGKGSFFELDIDGQTGEAEEERYFPQEEAFQYLNQAVEIGGNDTDSTDGEEDLTPFQKFERKMTDITPDKDRGVLKQVLAQGAGEIVPPDAFVSVHYNGFLEYSAVPYDSSRLRNEINRFALGRGEALPGMDIAVSTMKKGETSRFLISSMYAFGEMGCPPRIPPNATILFEIELLSFVDRAGVDEFYALRGDERRAAPLDLVLKVCRSHKDRAREMVKNRKYKPALRQYEKAITLLEGHHLQDEEEEQTQQKELKKCYINAALCCVNTGMPGVALRHCENALQIDRSDIKAYYWKGKAYRKLGEFEDARRCLKRAQQKCPNDPNIINELKELDIKSKQYQAFQKNMCENMFKVSKKAQANMAAKKAKEKEHSDAQFVQSIKENIRFFQNEGADLMELPIQASNFTDEEVDCVVTMAEHMGLDSKVTNNDNTKVIRLLKKRPEMDVAKQ